MSRGPETVFIQSVHRHLRREVYAMKNHNEYNGGIADCWYDGPRGDLWVEYKFLELPKRATTLIDLCGGKNPPLSHLQQQWLADRAFNGRSVAVVVGCKEGGVWFDPMQWTKPLTTDAFRQALVSRNRIADWIGSIVYG